MNESRQQPVQQDDERLTAIDANSPMISADFEALISAIRDEGKAGRSEEQREDKGKARREKITIALLAATLVAVGWQVHEMIKVYEPIKEQAEAARRAADATTRAAEAATKQSEIATKQAENSDRAIMQSQRAWVGPQNASFSAEPAIGKAVDLTITYQNTGHEPALGFVYFVDQFSVATSAEGDKAAGERIQRYINQCKALKDWPGGSVVYPTTSGFGGGYSLNDKSTETFVDDAVVKGEKIVFVEGCFSYRTFNAAHHSYFCYFFQKDKTKIQNLNICANGHFAD